MRKKESEMDRIGTYIKKYVKGKTPKVLIDEKTEGVLPYLSPDYLRGNCPPEQYAECVGNAVFVKDGEVIVLWDGSNAGEIFISKNGILASTMTLLEINEQELDKKYFGYTFQNLEYILRAKTAGSGIPHADKGIINSLEFYKPNKSEQIVIANILSKVDEAIASVQSSIAAAERLKKSLMQNLLIGKMKPDGTFRTPEEFYIDEKFGKVPTGWEVKRIKDFGEIQTGKTPPTDEPEVFSDKENGFMFITPGDLDVAKYIEETERYVSEKGIRYSYVLPKGSVCEVCIGSTIGKIGITTAKCCSNQQITSVIVNNEHDAEYLYYAMLSRREHFKSVAGINATPQINKSGYSKYRVLCPKDKLEQISIAKRISSVDKSINEQDQKIKSLMRLKMSLMQNLLTGKVIMRNK
ncbi:MAG: restriction endonuclease subunit S [Bacteroidaceae bacterium]|nr:restriction endonuclease subunit S [Bacteroidaceae bacterium]